MKRPTGTTLNTSNDVWRLAALCRGADVSLFFHPDGERGEARRHRQQQAKAICARCQVLTECRTQAVASAEPFGVWGGLTEEERSHLLPDWAVRLRTHR